MRTLTVTAAVLAATILVPTAAQAATPNQAHPRITACLKRAGATRIEHGANHIAHFGGRPDGMGWDRWVSWSYLTMDNDQVWGLMTSENRLTRLQKQRVNRCLRPYGGSA